MPTFEQFYNNTLPQIVNVINMQATELNNQRIMIYVLGAVVGMLIILTIIGKYIKVERKRGSK